MNGPEGCKNGGTRGCKNSEKNITDLFLDGDTLKSKAKTQNFIAFFPLNRLIAFYDGYLLSDGMLLVFEYFDFIKV